MLKRNTGVNEWILGLNLMNQYTVDFKMDSTNNQFAITNYNTNKPWTSN